MEAAVINVLIQRIKYYRKWRKFWSAFCETVQIHQIPYTEIKLEIGKTDTGNVRSV